LNYFINAILDYVEASALVYKLDTSKILI